MQPSATWNVCSALVLLLCGLTSPGMAQGTLDLDPERWFPMELGNAWHYHFSEAGSDCEYIVMSDRDTLVDGQRWVRFTQTHCYGLSCKAGSFTWYHMTADHYLVYRPGDNLRADTLWRTGPRSVFSVDVPPDTTLSLIEGSGATRPVDVFIETNTVGRQADSTDVTLSVTDNALFTRSYVYKIGLSRIGIEATTTLIGAFVNGLSYGDTTLIRTVFQVHTESTLPPSRPHLAVDAYPEPFHDRLVISGTAKQGGLLELAIFNVLGQRVHQATLSPLPGQPWRHVWSPGQNTRTGVYFLKLSRKETEMVTRLITRL
jgi:hypothetical protein